MDLRYHSQTLTPQSTLPGIGGRGVFHSVDRATIFIPAFNCLLTRRLLDVYCCIVASSESNTFLNFSVVLSK